MLPRDGAANCQFVRSNPCGEPAGHPKPSEPLQFQRKRLLGSAPGSAGSRCASPALDDDHRRDYLAGMSPPPEQPPASSPAKPKLTPEERRAREVDD